MVPSHVTRVTGRSLNMRETVGARHSIGGQLDPKSIPLLD